HHRAEHHQDPDDRKHKTQAPPLPVPPSLCANFFSADSARSTIASTVSPEITPVHPIETARPNRSPHHWIPEPLTVAFRRCATTLSESSWQPFRIARTGRPGSVQGSPSGAARLSMCSAPPAESPTPLPARAPPEKSPIDAAG